MSVYRPSLIGIYTPLPSAVRTATNQITKQGIMDPSGLSGVSQEATGLIAYLNVTAVPTIDTLLIKLQEQEPVSGTWNDVAVSLAQVLTGLIKLKILPGITPVAAGVGGISVADFLPPLWRLQIVHSAGSNFTYSLAVGLYA